MKNKVRFLGVLILAAVFAFTLGSCKEDTPELNDVTEDPTTNFILEPALRAVPRAASTSEIRVLDSYTDETENWYLIDVGSIQNTYVSTFAIAHFNGLTPVSIARTTINENTVTEAVTKTVSDSVMISSSLDTKVSVSTTIESKVKSLTTSFSAKFGFSSEVSNSFTNTNTSMRSTQESLSSAQKFAEQITTSFTIWGNGEPAGWYRYALYSVCDVYFVIAIDDNQDLLHWDTIVIPRDGLYIPHMDYSSNGNFDNSPIDDEITFAEDFYKTLPKPSSNVPFEFPATRWTNVITIRTEEKTINDDPTSTQDERSEFYNIFDFVYFNAFTIDGINVDINKMRQDGYKTISFYFKMDIREIDDGYQTISLFNSSTSLDFLGTVILFHGGLSNKNTNWARYYEDVLKFEKISIDSFPNDHFVIRYGARGGGKNDWMNKNIEGFLLFEK